MYDLLILQSYLNILHYHKRSNTNNNIIYESKFFVEIDDDAADVNSWNKSFGVGGPTC